MKTTPTIAIALQTVLLPQARADDSTATKAKLGIVYKSVEKVPLRLDLHDPEVPPPKAKYPLVVRAHGGDWSAGSRTIGDCGVRFCGVSALTASGFCVASVDYRNLLTPNTVTRIPVKDVVQKTSSQASPMPTGLANVLTQQKILDLLGFLEPDSRCHPTRRSNRHQDDRSSKMKRDTERPQKVAELRAE